MHAPAWTGLGVYFGAHRLLILDEVGRRFGGINNFSGEGSEMIGWLSHDGRTGACRAAGLKN